jgi:hypothetical protein
MKGISMSWNQTGTNFFVGRRRLGESVAGLLG